MSDHGEADDLIRWARQLSKPIGTILRTCWTDPPSGHRPSIQHFRIFHLLLIDDMGSASDLYIKMNSRGRSLTPFENFKPLLEKAIGDSPRAREFAARVDGVWADVMSRIRDPDSTLFDAQFLNYLRFVIDVCEWR